MTTDATGPAPQSLHLDTTDFTTKLASADQLAKRFSTSLGKAFTDVAVKGKTLGDAIGQIGVSLSKLALTSALKPLEDSLGKILSGFGSGVANTLSSSFGASDFGAASGAPTSILPFADGGIIATPTYFPLSGGTGLAGEAGAEAILPLARGSDGGLGVRMHGAGTAGAVSVTFNVSTPDVEGFRRSEAEVTAQLSRAVQRGQRGL